MLAQLTSLTSLELAWCSRLTNAGVAALAPLRQLVHLDLSGCRLLTEAGLGPLTRMTALRQLSLLNLGSAGAPCLTDAALKRLSSLGALRVLSLGMPLAGASSSAPGGGGAVRQPGITDKGLSTIACYFTVLDRLELLALDVSDAAIAELVALPQLQVCHSCGSLPAHHAHCEHERCCIAPVFHAPPTCSGTPLHIDKQCMHHACVSLLCK
jgi:Leucine Rich repeat